jgi:hypothetical protein
MPAPSRRAKSTILPFNGPWTGPALSDAALLIARVAKASSARWSRRVPLSVRVSSSVTTGTAKRVTITAGGRAAPQAYVMEGRNSGAPIAHPVFGHGERLRGTAVGKKKNGKLRYEPPGWTWARQIPVRPFMAQAAEAAAGSAADEFANRMITEWARASGFR